MGDRGQADSRTTVLYQRLEVLVAQRAELENLRRQVLTAEERTVSTNRQPILGNTKVGQKGEQKL
ncbi:hypothetical protein XH99_07355 [Bradyrhizobium nanningense]|uniref:Uncharacterized protein n=1 Tax=Bradyrhizobium nanningense TaxID=1325118 RepID=A0A4Q0SCS1_9BRAD|nr:hypothetical protein XH84_12445 [Bradyrhizobium nanningense]RXH36501.1 hypothetical protein XH99_07355 [Bradyrhizobium nanningense]